MRAKRKLLATALSSFLLLGNTTASREPPIAETTPDHLLYIYSIAQGGPAGAGAQLSASRRLWDKDDRLKICFFGGNPVVKALVASVASGWSIYSPVKFDFGTPGTWRSCTDSSAGFSQIRVGFGERGYWSAIGTDSINILNASQPSMNLEQFDSRYNPFQYRQGVSLTPDNVVALADPYDRGTILHEFGHALGLLHEHQNPSLNCHDEIKWTGPANVYDYYGGSPNFWDRDKVDFNIGSVALSAPDYASGAPDPQSIMMYAQPAAIFKDPQHSKCLVAPNEVLSSLDKQYIRQIYAVTSAPIEQAATLPTISPAVAASPAGRADLLTRVNADLLSDDTSTRRQARKQLASLLQTTGSTSLAADLLQGAVHKSYRQMLGVTEAVSNTSLLFKTDQDAQSRALNALSAIDSGNHDLTLKSNIDKAIVVVKGQ